MKKILLPASTLIALCFGQAASAQIFGDCGRDGTIRRDPGAMVASGICVARALANSGQANLPVTETDDLTPEQVFLVDAIEIVFEQINAAIEAFHLLLVARAGDSSSSGTTSKRAWIDPLPSRVANDPGARTKY